MTSCWKVWRLIPMPHSFHLGTSVIDPSKTVLIRGPIAWPWPETCWRSWYPVSRCFPARRESGWRWSTAGGSRSAGCLARSVSTLRYNTLGYYISYRKATIAYETLAGWQLRRWNESAYMSDWINLLGRLPRWGTFVSVWNIWPALIVFF